MFIEQVHMPSKYVYNGRQKFSPLKNLVCLGRQAKKHKNSTEHSKCFMRVIPDFTGNI